MGKRTMLLTVAGTVALVAAVATVALRGAETPQRPRRSDPDSTVQEVPQGPALEAPLPTARAPSHATAAAPIPADEVSLMAQMRELLPKQPERSLNLARLANERFPNSPHAAERNWILIKSLDNMERFEEARAEAVIMVKKYKDTPWAQDVERHLLVNPATHPSERGYTGVDPPPE